MESESQSSGQQSITSTQVRGKTDPAWGHVRDSLGADGKVVYTCLYCSNSFKGGDINRMKYHLAGVRGQVSSCKKVPSDVRAKMKGIIDDIDKKRKESIASKKVDLDNAYEAEDYESQDTSPVQKNDTYTMENKGKKRAISGFFTPTSIKPNSQPTIKSALAGKEARRRTDLAVAKWLYDACIPLNAINSPYFKPALDAIAAFGVGYDGPSYHDLRINLLKDCKQECALLIDRYRNHWKESGCTIMADGWTDQRQRTLINFLIYCPTGITFIKSVDASDHVKDATMLCNLFKEVVEWVGPSNVVQVVTDNAANYQAAGNKLTGIYSHIFWTPCAAHCINLLLKDIASMPDISETTRRASKVTIFVYNHIAILSWLRKRPNWTEIVRPGVTRFATAFITLKSLYDHKNDLQALATSKFFNDHKLSRIQAAKRFHKIVLDDGFWIDCVHAVNIAAPVIKLLRIVDSDARPSLPYVYDGMMKVERHIKSYFKGKEALFKPYIDFMNARWEKHFKHPIHQAAYYLNPAVLYDPNFVEPQRVMTGLITVLAHEAHCDDTSKALNEIKFYRDQLQGFSRVQVVANAKKMSPDEWWKLFAIDDAPTLRKTALRVLSQTAASSGCERNWSVFERIHTKKRNRLAHERLNDLVYVAYNLRLSNRHRMKRSYDALDDDYLDMTDCWVVDDEPQPELDVAELENALYEDEAIATTSNQGLVDEFDDIAIPEDPIVDPDEPVSLNEDVCSGYSD